MSRHGHIRAERPTPSRAKLIHLLVEERTQLIAYRDAFRAYQILPTDYQRSQARREIESEVLRPIPTDHKAPASGALVHPVVGPVLGAK